MSDIELLAFGFCTAFFVVVLKSIVQTLVESWSKKKWVELTNKEILDCFRIDMTEVEIGRAIESQVKEKNNAT